MLLSAEGKLWKQTLYASIVRQTLQEYASSAWVCQNKELAGGKRMGQNDLECFMAETKRIKKATTTKQCRWGSWRLRLRLGKMETETSLSNMRPPQSRFNLFRKLATKSSKKGASLAQCKNTKQKTTACLAKENSTPHHERSILQKRKKTSRHIIH